MGHYYSELPENQVSEPRPKTESAKEPKKTNHLGFTLIWEGRATDFIKVIRTWSMVSDDFLKIETAQNPQYIVLRVANEHIDWAYYRKHEQYRPANSNNVRENKLLTADEFMGSIRRNYSGLEDLAQ